MTLHEWTHSEATLKQLAPQAYKALSVNIERSEARKREAWQRVSRLAQHSAGQHKERQV